MSEAIFAVPEPSGEDITSLVDVLIAPTASLEAGIAQLGLITASLPPRLHASVDATVDETLPLFVAGREGGVAQGAVRIAGRSRAKPLDAACEAARVGHDQLAWYAEVIDALVDEGNVACDEVAAAAEALLKLHGGGVADALPLPAWYVAFPQGTAVDLVYLRDGAKGLSCDSTPRGPGVKLFTPGPDAGNDFEFAVVMADSEGAPMDSSKLLEQDVHVRLECGPGQGSFSLRPRLTGVTELRPGVFGVGYTVASVVLSATLQVHVSVLGHPLASSPWTVPGNPLPDSAILECRDMLREDLQHFLCSLTRDWLPDAIKFTLLYRGTRDGMHAKGFHEACDGKGPTITLIQASGNFRGMDPSRLVPALFGGYTQVSWQSPSRGHTTFHDDKAFVFHVLPRPAVQGALGGWHFYPVKPERAGEAMSCAGRLGPGFGDSIILKARSMSLAPTDKFMLQVAFGRLQTYGSRDQYRELPFRFEARPEEIEVYAVQ